MVVIDSHCDLISKMWFDPTIQLTTDRPDVAVNLSRLQQAKVALQFFAIYLPERIKRPQFKHIVASIDVFRQRILSHNQMMIVRDAKDLELAEQNGKIGALLTLEGVAGLQGSVSKLQTAYEMGVRSIGLTWNNANWAADGVLETIHHGLSEPGIALVKECNRLGILLDVSHLAEAAFWQVTEISDKPLIASHSNVYDQCRHPRNLTNRQIEFIISRSGMIGLTFVPWFVKADQPSIKDLFMHIDHICALGGQDQIGFGSDFDGIDRFIPGLEHTGHYEYLANELVKFYSSDLAELFLGKNWRRFLRKNLTSNL